MKIGTERGRALAGLLMLAFAATAAAQSPGGGCAHTRASPVRARVDVVGGVPCGGGGFAFGGVEVKVAQTGCPLAIVSWPPYHEEVDTGNDETETTMRAMLSPKVAYFECVRHTFLLIPIGSTCELQRIVDGAAFVDLMTIGCAGAPQDGG